MAEIARPHRAQVTRRSKSQVLAERSGGTWQKWAPVQQRIVAVTRAIVRQARLGRSLSQDEAAKRFAQAVPPDGYGWGMTGGSWSRLETSDTHMANLRLGSFLTMLNTGGVRLSEWAREVEASLGLSKADPLEGRLLRAFRSLRAEGDEDDTHQRQAVRAVEGMAAEVLASQRRKLHTTEARASDLTGVLDSIDQWHDDAVTGEHPAVRRA